MIKFRINPQDNGPLLKTQTPFIFTHPSVGQHLHAFLHTTHCTAELRTLQHTRYEMGTYESHLDVQHSADQCMLWGSLYAQPTEAGKSETTQGDLALQSQHQELMF